MASISTVGVPTGLSPKCGAAARSRCRQGSLSGQVTSRFTTFVCARLPFRVRQTQRRHHFLRTQEHRGGGGQLRVPRRRPAVVDDQQRAARVRMASAARLRIRGCGPAAAVECRKWAHTRSNSPSGKVSDRSCCRKSIRSATPRASAAARARCRRGIRDVHCDDLPATVRQPHRVRLPRRNRGRGRDRRQSGATISASRR